MSLTVSIGFSTSDWWVSRVIRFFTRAPVSHTYIVFDDPSAAFRHEVYEAAWCGFRISCREALTRGSTRIVREIPVGINAMNALTTCREWLETPYDYLGLLGQAWVQIGLWLGQRWENPCASKHFDFCSEIAVQVLQRGCFAPVYGLIPSEIDPATLEKILLLRA